MTPGESQPGNRVSTLREAVREAIGPRSIREAAAEMGLSHTGLRGFLGGATPHRHTRLKVERWLAGVRRRGIREAGHRYGAPDRNTFLLAVALVRSLAEEADPELAGKAEAEFVSLLRGIYEDGGDELPPWLEAGSTDSSANL